MLLRWTALPPALKQSISLQLERSTLKTVSHNAAPLFRRPYASSQFFTRTPPPAARDLRKLLWLLPVAGGAALYLTPRSTSPVEALLKSPQVIPCQEREEIPMVVPILSPAEPHVWDRIAIFFHDKIWEPVLTARRFIHLLYLFLLVLLSAPMILIGPPDQKLGGDRWGAVWWYGYLTQQLQRAGPTFVKVRFLRRLIICSLIHGSLSSRNGPQVVRTYFHPKCVSVWDPSIRAEGCIRWITRDGL